MRALFCCFSAASLLFLPACHTVWNDPVGDPMQEGRGVRVHPDTVLLDDVPGVFEVETGADWLHLVTDGTDLGLAPGKMVVGQRGGGYLRRVVAVTPTRDGLWLDTVPATLGEAILEASVETTVVLGLRDASRWDLSGKVLLDQTVTHGAATAHARIVTAPGAYISVEPVFDLSIDLFDETTQVGFDTTIAVDYAADFVATVDGALDLEHEQLLLTHTVPFSFWIGPVPVVGEAAIEILGRADVEAEGALSETLHTEATADGHFAAGYAGEWWADADIAFDADASLDTPEAEGDYRARATLVARVSTTFYGTNTPWFEVGPWVEAASCDAGVGVTVTSGVDGAYGYRADVFGWEIGEYGPETYSAGPWDVWSWECEA
jgi:hypothetical protein